MMSYHGRMILWMKPGGSYYSKGMVAGNFIEFRFPESPNGGTEITIQHRVLFTEEKDEIVFHNQKREKLHVPKKNLNAIFLRLTKLFVWKSKDFVESYHQQAG
ncbi:hypothetical protein ACFL29_01520 [Patescibacteria group bacterium]